MASVSLEKHGTGQTCSGIIPHNYREREHHSNKDIDPLAASRNRYYGCATGNEAREILRKAIKEADEKHPPKRVRADRKTSLGLSIAAPREGMPIEDQVAFCDRAWEKLGELFGDNLLFGALHADEIHTYIDPHDKQVHTSRVHLHAEILPVSDEHGLNMKNFYKKDLPVRINEALDEICKEMFGFPYQDGSKQGSRGRVEDLKAESVIAAREEVQNAQDALETVQLATQEAQETLQNVQKAKEKEQVEHSTLKRENESLRGEKESLRSEVEQLTQRVENAEQRAEKAEQRTKKAEGALVHILEKVDTFLRAHKSLQNVLRWLSPTPAKKRIEREADRTVEEVGAALSVASESVEDLFRAEEELERGTNTIRELKREAQEEKEEENGWER